MLKFKLIKENWKVINWEQFKKLFSEYFWKQKDWTYTLEIKKWYKGRSLNQNNYYWNMLTEFAQEVWVTPEELHEEMKYRFLRIPFKGINWEDMYKIRSTTELTTIQFEEYIEMIRREAQEEYNLMLNLPNDTFI